MSDDYSVSKQTLQLRPIMTIDFRCCECGHHMQIPIRPEWDNPVYVMEVERQHRLIREELVLLRKGLVELAGECVDAGVRPECLKRADEINERLNNAMKWFEDNQG